jgi:membrane-associated phospholipid phosphatase
MRELLVDLVPWGVERIVALQSTFGNALDPLFCAITWLGDAYVYLAFLPLALWRGDTPRAMRLALLLLFSIYVNLLLKGLFAIPRPFLISSAVQVKDIVTGYAFPSGHAQGVTALWLGLTLIYRRRWPLVLGALLIPLVSFSRVYLGVHYPQDAIGGVVVGLAIVGIFGLLDPPLSRWWRLQPTWIWIALCVVVPAAMAGLAPDPDAHAIAGAILGLSLGRAIEARWKGIQPAPGAMAVILRFLVGAAVAGLAYIITALALDTAWAGGIAPPTPVIVARYALVGLAISLGAPWLFLCLELSVATIAPRERDR